MPKSITDEKTRTIFHIDLDAFYASVEIQRNPSLKDKPVIIGADPKSGTGRGVVMTCSYKAREFGIRSAMPISRAYELCPDGIYLRPDMNLYRIVSQRVMELLRKFSDRFQQTSIDECFLDVTETVRQYKTPRKLAMRIQRELFTQEGLTCSIGISPNKPVSKIASDLNKPNGITLVEPYKIMEFLAPLPVSRISGVGAKTQERLKEMNINTIGDIQAHGLEKLVNALGKYGEYIWRIANGRGSSKVSEKREIKSISTERTFEVDMNDFKLISETLDKLATALHKHLQKAALFYKTITLKIRFEDFSTFTKSKTIGIYNNDIETIVGTVKKLFEQFMHKKKKIRLIGIRLSNLRKLEDRQQLLTNWL
ncbi:MAG: DNA polymerase IV [Candidatus Heimdallarchaeota archaeon]